MAISRIVRKNPSTKKPSGKALKRNGAKRAAKKAERGAPRKSAGKITVKKAAKKKTARRASPKAAKTAAMKPMKNAPVPSAGLKIGMELPDFHAQGTSGHEFSLKEHRGKKVVLYFYPKDATPGCTMEGHDFTKLLPEFKKAGAEVYGVSRDSLQSHEKFKEKECFDFELLSDPDENLCKMFDVIKEKNMYGRKVMGIERSTFVIDSNGKLAAEWRGVKVPGHAQEVLSKVQSVD
jgi:peroxiredoxin Q/BCP